MPRSFVTLSGVRASGCCASWEYLATEAPFMSASMVLAQSLELVTNGRWEGM